MPTIGQRIKQLRLENNLTQEDFGKLFGIVKSTVSMYESDKSIPDDEIKKKIAEYFQVTLDWLMGISEIRNPAGKEPSLDDEIMAIMRDLGPDITLQFYDLKGITDEEKENLKIFLQGLKARREQKKKEGTD
jgi:transcriptional regulator with XRE-family HTH domain